MRLLFAFVPVALFLTLATALCIRSGMQLDDSGYVLLRLADNLRLGDGPVFNAGDRRDLVESPAWIGLLALLGSSAYVPFLVQLLGLGLGVGTLLLVFAGPRLPVAGACASLFLALDCLYAEQATTGGSVPLAGVYLVVLYLLLRGARGRRDVATGDGALGWWAGAAVVFRYELACVAVPATLGWALADRRRGRAWLPLAMTAAATALGLALRARVFTGLPAAWAPWPPTWASVAAGAHAAGAMLVHRPLLLLAFFVAMWAWMRAPLRVGRSTGLAWGLLLLAAWALVPAQGGAVPVQLAAALPLAYSMAVEVVWRGSRTRLGLVVALVLLVAQPASTWTPAGADPEIGATYARLGQWLGTRAQPGTVVGARYVGALGYYSRLSMEDVEGRVSARVADARRLRSARTQSADFSAMLSLEPDLVVVAPGEPVPSAIVYVPTLDAVPPSVRGAFGVYRWAGSPVWKGDDRLPAAPWPSRPSAPGGVGQAGPAREKGQTSQGRDGAQRAHAG